MKKTLLSAVTALFIAALAAVTPVTSALAAPASQANRPSCGRFDQGRESASARASACTGDTSSAGQGACIAAAAAALEAAIIENLEANGVTMPNCPTAADCSKPNRDGCDPVGWYDGVADVTYSESFFYSPVTGWIYCCTITLNANTTVKLGCSTCLVVPV